MRRGGVENRAVEETVPRQNQLAVNGGQGFVTVERAFKLVRCAGQRDADRGEVLAEKVAAAGYRVSNIDVTMIAQRPKLKDFIPQMEANIALAVGIAASRVNVKATTEERLGFTGTGEGMACHAVCLLEE